jgi:hypothetical protein
LEGSINTVKENVVHLFVAAKETGGEINANKIKYISVLGDRNAG